MPEGSSNIGDSNIISAMQQLGNKEAAELRAEQQTSKGAFLESQTEVVNPFARLKDKSELIKDQGPRIREMLKAKSTDARLLPIEKFKDTAEGFQRRNPELKAPDLMLLRSKIKPGDTKEDILKTLQEEYPDLTLLDEVLDFLLQTTDGELAETIKEAKQEIHDQHAREITAGKNITPQARLAAEGGIGTPTALRDMYRDITGNPRDSTTLFEELSQKYEFKDLKKVINFLLHSLGADMKATGPSIPKGLLHRLFTETRSLQAILGVYRFFLGRMPLVTKMMKEQEIPLPDELTFESISKQFMTLSADRYPTSAKVLQQAVKLGIEKWIIAKIIVFSQMRDAIRQVAMNQIYKTLQHRDELYMCILEALEDLEDQLDDLEEQQEADEDDN